jgi:glycosyltransferase involved in cell wall biosynthesis
MKIRSSDSEEIELGNKKINVLHLGNPTGLYGAERWILALAKHLNVEKIKTTVGVIKDHPELEAPLCLEINRLGFSSVIFETFGRINIASIVLLRKYILGNQIDILHTHGYKTDVIGLLSAFGTRCRILTTPHGWTNRPDHKLMVYECFDRIILPFFDAVTVLSDEMYQGIIKIPGVRKKTHLIPNGVDISEIDDVSHVKVEIEQWKKVGAFVIGYIGRLERGKGIHTLINALTKLKSIDWRLAIIGEGKLCDSLKKLSLELDKEKRIHFFGFQKDRLSFLKGFDLFVLPSFSEGTPRCLMEAMAAGIPAIASNITGCRLLIKDGQNGLLFQPGNEVDLAKKVRVCLDNKSAAEKFAMNARLTIENKFSAARMAVDFQKLYESLKRN